jgi:hypothetical protein
MSEVRIDPDRRPQSSRLQLAPLVVKQCAAYDHRQRYGEQQQGDRDGSNRNLNNAFSHASIMVAAMGADRCTWCRAHRAILTRDVCRPLTCN